MKTSTKAIVIAFATIMIFMSVACGTKTKITTHGTPVPANQPILGTGSSTASKSKVITTFSSLDSNTSVATFKSNLKSAGFTDTEVDDIMQHVAIANTRGATLVEVSAALANISNSPSASEVIAAIDRAHTSTASSGGLLGSGNSGNNNSGSSAPSATATPNSGSTASATATPAPTGPAPTTAGLVKRVDFGMNIWHGNQITIPQAPAGPNQEYIAHGDIFDPSSGSCHIKIWKQGDPAPALGHGTFHLYMLDGGTQAMRDTEAASIQQVAALDTGTCPLVDIKVNKDN